MYPNTSDERRVDDLAVLEEQYFQLAEDINQVSFHIFFFFVLNKICGSMDPTNVTYRHRHDSFLR